jgi:hypothetical protein
MFKRILLFVAGAGILLGLVGCQNDPGTTPTSPGFTEADDDPYFNVVGHVYDGGEPLEGCTVEVRVKNFMDAYYTAKTVYTDEHGGYDASNVTPCGKDTCVRFTHPTTNQIETTPEWLTYPYETYEVDFGF